MGLDVQWQQLLDAANAILPLETELLIGRPVGVPWPLGQERVVASLFDCTADLMTVGHQIRVPTGRAFMARYQANLMADFQLHPTHQVVLIWDKAQISPHRRALYGTRYPLYVERRDPHGRILNPIKSTQTLAWDGRVYDKDRVRFRPGEYPIPDGMLSDVRRLLAYPDTKHALAAYICGSLMQSCRGPGFPHIIFDTPYVAGHSVCDGKQYCNRAVPPERCCSQCLSQQLPASIPNCAETDLLLHYYIRYFHRHHIQGPLDRIVVGRTNDRDHLVILCSPLHPEVAACVLWTKRTVDYSLDLDAQQVVKCTPAERQKAHPHKPIRFGRMDEMIRLASLQQLLGGPDLARLWSTCLALFLTGGDYCSPCPGMTGAAIVQTALTWTVPFLTYVRGDPTTGLLLLHIAEYARFVQAVYEKSGRSRSKDQRNASTLVRATFDAFYSVAYYSGAFAAGDCPSRTGPPSTAFGQTLTAEGALQPITTSTDLHRALDPLFTLQGNVPPTLLLGYSWTLLALPSV